MSGKISVIMPVYNAEKYLKEAIESVLGSSYRDLELILLNDGSTDSSAGICKEYSADSRVLYKEQPNSGAQIARKNAIEMSTGDYIAFVDSDDTISPHMFEWLIDAIEKNNADYAACQVTHEEYFDDKAPMPFTVYEGTENAVRAIYTQARGYMANKVYRRECLLQVDFHPDINLGEDGLFNLELARHLNRIVATNSRLYYYRVNDSSITHTHLRPYSKWEKEISGYYQLWLSHKKDYFSLYVSRMLVNCLVKGAEACVAEKKKQELKDIRQKAKEIDTKIIKTKRTKIQLIMIRDFLPIYKLFKKITLG